MWTNKYILKKYNLLHCRCKYTSNCFFKKIFFLQRVYKNKAKSERSLTVFKIWSIIYNITRMALDYTSARDWKSCVWTLMLYEFFVFP